MGCIQDGQVDMLACVISAGGTLIHPAQTSVISAWFTCLVMSKIAMRKVRASVLQSQTGCNGVDAARCSATAVLCDVQDTRQHADQGVLLWRGLCLGLLSLFTSPVASPVHICTKRLIVSAQ